jgi:hypothetical protein
LDKIKDFLRPLIARTLRSSFRGCLIGRGSNLDFRTPPFLI